MIKAIIAVIIGAVVLIVTMSTIDRNVTSGGGGGTAETTKLTVSIEGQVNKEGTFYINTGGTLADLIEAAGGVNGNADERAYNLDYVLKNNQNFYIAPLYDTSEVCTQVEITKYNINTASEEELRNINGVTARVATSILSYRSSGKKFERIEDLIDVEWIAATTFSKMKNYVTLK